MILRFEFYPFSYRLVFRMGSKRQHVPTGDTPGKPREKIVNQDKEPSSRKSLFGGTTGTETKKNPKWSTDENISAGSVYLLILGRCTYKQVAQG